MLLAGLLHVKKLVHRTMKKTETEHRWDIVPRPRLIAVQEQYAGTVLRYRTEMYIYMAKNLCEKIIQLCKSVFCLIYC